MGVEWKCVCKDCGKKFTYGDAKYKAGLARGWSRPERCDACRIQHSREIKLLGQPFYKARSLRPVPNPKELTSDLGRFNRADRPHKRKEITPEGLEPQKFGIKDDRILELFHFFKSDPGLQVVVVVGPTGSGKSTYFPYRLIETPDSYLDSAGERKEVYWTTPVENDRDLEEARREAPYTLWTKGLFRFHRTCPDDPRAVEHKVSEFDKKMFWRYGQVVVTQPRIQATRNIPSFIAKSMFGCNLGAGHDVGFKHSGAPNVDWDTKLAFVTDGSLINWLANGELDKINTIMIDEAHERSLNIDIIIGMLTLLLPRYPRLKLIIASATISADKFINHFNERLPRRTDGNGNVLPNCRIMKFEGKSFKATPHFRRSDEKSLEYRRLELPGESNGEERWEGVLKTHKEVYRDVAQKSVELLHAMYDFSPNGGYVDVEDVDANGNVTKDRIDMTERQGDILAFLHGEKPIENCCKEIETLTQNDSILQKNKGLKIVALPLYTNLEQSAQDKALKERSQSSEKLIKQILTLLLDMASGRKQSGDVLAILDVAGQIHNVCSILQDKIDEKEIVLEKKDRRPNILSKLGKKIKFYPCFTPETARQLFENSPERANLHVDPPSDDVLRVVVSTTRYSCKLNASEFAHTIKLPFEERRVVVSTNVAETSLTIHGVLHVVDSGLINQNKWDSVAEASVLSPILQSRAGCKQRWGRAGRLQAGDAWTLYTQAQFGKLDEKEERANPSPERCFDFYSKPEILRSPLEQVILTAKKSGVDELDPATFPWLDPPEVLELKRSKNSLLAKGALDSEGDLTERGLELSGMRMDAQIGVALILSDRFVCSIEMSAVVAFAQKDGKAAFLFDERWDDETTREIRRRQANVLGGAKDDLEIALNLISLWETAQESGRATGDFLSLFCERSKDLQQKQSGEFDASSEIQEEWSRLYDFSKETRTQAASNLVKAFRGKANFIEKRERIEEILRIFDNFERLNGFFLAVQRGWSFKQVWRAALNKIFSDEPIERFEFLAEPDSLDAYIENFRKVCADYPDQAKKVLLELPLATATAWANNAYLDPRFFIEIEAERRDYLEPFQTHKKGEETRPIDLSQIDRLRFLLAICLSRNICVRNAAGSYDFVDGSENLSEVEVRVDENSVCLSEPPAFFVCAKRRFGAQVAGKARTAFASFIVRLPEEWRDTILNLPRDVSKTSDAGIIRFLTERCARKNVDEHARIMSQLFASGGVSKVVLKEQAPNGDWFVVAVPPTSVPPVQISYKLNDDEQNSEDQVKSIAPAEVRNTRGLMSSRLRNLKAGIDITDEKFALTPNSYEQIFENNDVDFDERLEEFNVDAFFNASLPSKKLDWPTPTIEGTLQTSSTQLQKDAVVDAELLGYVSGDSSQPIFKYPPTEKQFNEFVSNGVEEKSENLRLYDLTTVRLESLSSGEYALIAREERSGCEISFGACDLSFSACKLVPEIVFDAIGKGGRFQARLVEVDRLRKRIRMTTHFVGETLNFEDSRTEREVLLLQKRFDRHFVRLPMPQMEKRGFVCVAQMGSLQLNERNETERYQVRLCLSQRTRRPWNKSIKAPKELCGKGNRQESVCWEGRISSSLLEEWRADAYKQNPSYETFAEASHVLYDLYEKSWRLQGIDREEYARRTKYLNRDVEAKTVRIVPNAGIVLEFPQDQDLNVWLPRDEYSWFVDETFETLRINEKLTVRAFEIDLEGDRILATRKRRTPNPYTNYQKGENVLCRIVKKTENGVEVSVDRLRGWIRKDAFARLPQESISDDGACEFEATVITDDAEEKERITLSRRPVVQRYLRQMCGSVFSYGDEKNKSLASNAPNDAVVLEGRIVDVRNNKSGRQELRVELASRVELAPPIEVFVSEFEFSWNPKDSSVSFACGKTVSVVLLNEKFDETGRVYGSVKRARFVRWYDVSGEKGFWIGKGGQTIKALKNECSNVEFYGDNIICADSLYDLNACVRKMEAQAERTRCSIEWGNAPNRRTDRLETLALPYDARKRWDKERTPQTTTKPVTYTLRPEKIDLPKQTVNSTTTYNKNTTPQTTSKTTPVANESARRELSKSVVAPKHTYKERRSSGFIWKLIGVGVAIFSLIRFLHTLFQ